MNNTKPDLRSNLNSSNKLEFYSRHIYWFLIPGAIVCVVASLNEIKIQSYWGAGFDMVLAILFLNAIVRPIIIIGDGDIKVRGNFGLIFHALLWSDVDMVKIYGYGDPKKSSLAIYESHYKNSKFKISPEKLKLAIEFIAVKIPPEKLVFEQ
jgi:hypothetical protein